MIDQRLIEGGREGRLRESQFGFQPKRGAADAMMLVLRMAGAARMGNGRGLALSSLDWAKAFGRLKPDCMCNALTRFAMPELILNVVRDIYAER
eukprot:964905-Pyramimonas_sp.AAC.1